MTSQWVLATPMGAAGWSDTNSHLQKAALGDPIQWAVQLDAGRGFIHVLLLTAFDKVQIVVNHLLW